MTTRFWRIAVATLGLLPQIIGCADNGTNGTEDSASSAEQACLLANTANGVFNFNGTQQQVCGVGRHDFAASVAAGSTISLPAAKFGLSLNLNLVAVRLTSNVGGFIELTHKAAGSACGSAQSWKFDNDSNPKEIILCNCGSSQQVDGAVFVDLLVGCGGSTSTSTRGTGGNTSTTTVTGTGGSTSASTCPTGRCGTTSTCATGQCGTTSTCATGQCGTTSTCATGQCGSSGIQIGGGVQVDVSVQIGGSVQLGGGSTAIGAGIDTSTSGCSCLWNIVFEDGGCTADQLR